MRKEPAYKQKQKTSAEHWDHTKKHYEDIRAISGISKSVNSIAEEYRSSREQTERQEKAKSNRDWITISCIAATAVAACLTIVVSHCDTIEALEEARHSSRQQHVDTINALTSAQRAFISVSMNYLANTDPKAGEVFWFFNPLWKNSGNTPTKNMKNHVNMSVGSTEPPYEWAFPDLWDKHIPINKRAPVNFGVGAKEIFPGATLAVRGSDLLSVSKGSSFFYIWGWTIYNDVFPDTKQHVTRFSFRVLVSGDTTKADGVSFLFPLTSKYNCTDDECDTQGFGATWNPENLNMPPD